MAERLNNQSREAISLLPTKLKALAEEIEHEAGNSDQSFHDAMCDLYESNPSEYTQEEIETTLTAMGSYWD